MYGYKVKIKLFVDMPLISVLKIFYRVTHGRSKKMAATITILCVFYFINHFAYLSYNTFDYSYNMKVNIVTGVSTLVPYAEPNHLFTKKTCWGAGFVVLLT